MKTSEHFDQAHEALYDLTLFVSGASDPAARTINHRRGLGDLYMLALTTPRAGQ